MNKEEILAKSRAENVNGDERDMQNRERAYSVSATVSTVVCVVMAMVEGKVFHRSALDIWVIYAAIEFTTALSGAVFSKKKWLIGLSVFMGLLLVAMIFLYIYQGVTGNTL